MKRNLKRIVLILAAVMVLMTAATAMVSACTTIFVGADRNTEGTPFVCRTEDYGSDMNKMWFISEAGAFKQGSTYKGCPEYGGIRKNGLVAVHTELSGPESDISAQGVGAVVKGVGNGVENRIEGNEHEQNQEQGVYKRERPVLPDFPPSDYRNTVIHLSTYN